jgi:hypothetical protein
LKGSNAAKSSAKDKMESRAPCLRVHAVQR